MRLGMNEARKIQRQAFLAAHRLSDAKIEPLTEDASFRRYFRLRHGQRPLMLMDAPPEYEDVVSFITVDRHLIRLGLRAPQVLAHDSAAGFVLLEDFGDDTYTRLLAKGADEYLLYSMAVDVLTKVHRHAAAVDVAVPHYDQRRLYEEAELLLDWYCPACQDAVVTEQARVAYRAAWHEVFTHLPSATISLVLRDFHVDNLMRVYGQETECGLLDFQDAVVGPSAYDLVSLLEDARRDIDTKLVAQMKERYFAAMPDSAPAVFDLWFTVLGAQRHCKVAGIFVRLCVRDRKSTYLKHIPRVMRLLESHLSDPVLAPVKAWLDRHLADRLKPLDFDPDELRTMLVPPI